MSLNNEISSAISPIIESTGNYLEEVKVLNAGKNKLITIIVDSDSHLNLDQVTQITKSISTTLDELSALGNSPFTLEVTSPGIDRPLTLERHWRKNIGKLVKVVKNNDEIVEGRILSLTSNSAILDSAEINFTDVKKATLVIEFKK